MTYPILLIQQLTQIYDIMKRALFTFLAIIALFNWAPAQQKAKTFPNGIKVLGTTEITSIPVTSKLMVLDQTGYSTEITLANLVSQLNLATGNLTQEEVEDIIGPMLENGSHTGATFTYNDVAGTVEINVTGGGGGTWGSITGTLSTQADLQAALDARVDVASDSPIQDIKYWIGDKNAFGGRTPLEGYVYIVTDSIPDTPPGGGDMERINYDADSDNVVDDSEQLGGLPPSNYTKLTQEEIQDFIGPMVTGNTESGITVTYDDPNDEFDFTVTSNGDMEKTTYDTDSNNIVDEAETVPNNAITKEKLADSAVGTSELDAIGPAAAGDALIFNGTDLYWDKMPVYTYTTFTPTITASGGGGTYSIGSVSAHIMSIGGTGVRKNRVCQYNHYGVARSGQYESMDYRRAMNPRERHGSTAGFPVRMTYSIAYRPLPPMDRITLSSRYNRTWTGTIPQN